ncbi:MAG TPA: BPSS1780 family membrane protein [Casimicrobiaceae bacterium]|nr:BPSS1780 family membrane protein [Casimicrobiaceae bacterium]
MSEAPIVYTTLAARHGILWLARAATMFRAAPLPWLMLMFVYYLLVSVLEFGPWASVGQFVAPVLRPVFAVGFLAAAWTQERGGSPRFEHLFRGFRSDLVALLALGVVFLAGAVVAIRATALVDGGVLIALLSGTTRPSEAVLTSGPVQGAMLLGGLCALPVVLAIWFAPALVVFNDARTRSALSISLRAALANWRAIGVYALAVFAFGGIVPVAVMAIAQALGDAEAALVALLVVMPYMFVFVATLHISDYLCYRDVFPADEPLDAAPAPMVA